jgi:hypothetical protein
MKPSSMGAEETQPIIIPTLSRAKIPRNLSYPVGAGAISEALASVAQFQELKLIFYSSKFDIGVRSGRYELRSYEFLRVEYLHNAKPGEEQPVSSLSLYPRPPQSRWKIVVQPVPRVLRHQINQYILKSALPEVRRWLTERTQLSRQGSELLAFFYDEKAEEFTPRVLIRLEPERK